MRLLRRFGRRAEVLCQGLEPQGDSGVPIYPRDLLGELYRGEWKDVWMRPTFASVRLKKAGLQGDIKKLPPELVTTGPGNEAMRSPGIAQPPLKIATLGDPVERLGPQCERASLPVARRTGLAAAAAGTRFL
ncbi:Uncharacterized protein SCF082_LOCUS2133 [Durusdinium trenchii]|uniref:Uncharacterized protein n=1 Tax=Durusdinium trenchii TaxID=1381693 RepID=A0ABP0HJ00_9DINO